jgi:hypothetical protein
MRAPWIGRADQALLAERSLGGLPRVQQGIVSKDGKGKIFERYLFQFRCAARRPIWLLSPQRRWAILGLTKPVPRLSGRPQKIRSARL